MESLGKLILRVSIGGLMLFHGIPKITQGVSMIGEMLVKSNLPRELMWGVYAGEVLAPILLIIGWMTRPASLLIAFTMVMSIYLVFRDSLFKLNEYGALTYEMNLLYLFGALAIMFLGAGQYSISGGKGKLD
jgi:putative oxidoreductase